MNRVIWKRTLEGSNWQVSMPPDARLVAVGTTDHHNPCVWFSLPYNEVDNPDKSHWILRTLTPVPTGGPGYVDDVLDYLGTVVLLGGSIVLHIYEHRSSLGQWGRES